MPKILIVEDDKKIGRGLEEWLQADHYLVEWVTTGAEAQLRLKLGKFDAVILDWGLPDMSGLEILRNCRRQKTNIPVLMLTGRTEIEDKTAGFETGADDYLTKPFHPKELSLRLMALLRRPGEVVETALSAGPLTLDPQNYCATLEGKTVRLVPKEFDLLSFFIRHPGQLFSAESLLERVWLTESTVSPDVVKVYIQRLRAKLHREGKPSLITTVHGRGYRFDSCSQ